MSTKNRATGDTENEFQAALVTYTKAGNKTAAMRRLWNAAYEMGKSAGDDAVFEGRAVKEKTSDRVKEARLLGLDEGRKEGFVEGWQASEKAASTLPAFQLSFAAGRIEGLAAGTELGRETEGRRWTDGGHLDNGTCRARDESQNIAALTVSPAPLPPHLDHARTPGAFSWADDADSLPIHTILVTPPQPRDFRSYVRGRGTRSTHYIADMHDTTGITRDGNEGDHHFIRHMKLGYFRRSSKIPRRARPRTTRTLSHCGLWHGFGRCSMDRCEDMCLRVRFWEHA
ncbi:hypothetical protein B0H10DRAFT_2090149, partial [Mycena sp. CBHHK59/15]